MTDPGPPTEERDCIVVGGGLEVRVLATPGHTSDSLSFVLADAVLTGDTVLGRGTTVVAHPDDMEYGAAAAIARRRSRIATSGGSRALTARWSLGPGTAPS